MSSPLLERMAQALVLLVALATVGIAEVCTENGACAAHSLLQTGRRYSGVTANAFSQVPADTFGQVSDVLGAAVAADPSGGAGAPSETGAAPYDAAVDSGNAPYGPGVVASTTLAVVAPLVTTTTVAPVEEAVPQDSATAPNVPSFDAASASGQDGNASNATSDGAAPHNLPLVEPRLEDALLNFTLRVRTAPESLDQFGGTETAASVAFMVGGVWTEDLPLCNSSSSGHTVQLAVRLPEWPVKLRLTSLGVDSWMIDSVILRFHTVDVSVLAFDAEDDSAAYSNSSKFWLDGDEEAPVEQVYDVPPLPADVQSAIAASHGCATVEDPLVEASFGVDVAAPGTPCVFGVHVGDEGSHCIMDDGLYGSFGWCYTDADGGAFGACNEACPLVGPMKIIVSKLDEVLRRLSNASHEHPHA